MALTPGDPVARARHRRRRALSRYLRTEIVPHSRHFGPVLARLGMSDGRLERLEDLARIPPTTLDDLGDGASAVLRPTEDALVRGGTMRMRWGTLVARVTGQGASVNRRLVEPAYKPAQWHLHDGLPVASTSEDLEMLAEQGRRWLELAGVAHDDTVASVLPSGPDLPFWEMALGARRAGVAFVPLGSDVHPADVAALGPEVLVGSPPVLIAALAHDAYADARPPATVIAVTEGETLGDRDRARLEDLTGDAAVVEALAVPGVRSVWASCGTTAVFHPDPAVEHVEVAGPDGRLVSEGEGGQVVWTGIGWKGTALLRLATGLSGRVSERSCPHCGRDGPWVTVDPPPDPVVERLVDVLGSDSDVVEWMAQLNPVGADVTIALADRRRQRTVVRRLTDQLDGATVQVARRAEVDALLDASGDDRILDRR